MSEKQVHQFQAEVNQVLRLVINSLYRHREVFLRELISNASDALDRLRFRAIREPDLLPSGKTLRIRLIVDRDAGTLTVQDNGIGMTAEELEKNLGTIAWSGSREFLEQLQHAQEAEEKGLQLIGQFGVGFYSSYLVADRVEVVSRAAGDDTAHRWTSDAKENFTIEPAELAERGTSVILHLKEDQRDYLDSFRVRQLVAQYSDYVSHPIEMPVEKTGGEQKETAEFQAINTASALWQRPPTEVKDEQYEEFYKHLTRDWEGPLAWRHFHIEGTQMFTGLLFIPRRPPFDLFDPNPHHGVRLHVQRVFVMDEAEEFVPRWLRFVRGVIDSEDLPLNVSREVLQDSRAARTIQQQVIGRTLDLLDELAQDRPEDYLQFWEAFGAVLKEGFHLEPGRKDRLAKLVRYQTSTGTELTSLDHYVDRMPQGQPAIYYAAGLDRRVVERSPHLEALRKRGFEVLLMTDPIDPFAVSVLEKYRDLPLVSAMTEELKLPDEPAEEGETKVAPVEADSALMERIQKVLSERVGEVRASSRLIDSPACLVVPEGGLQPHIERMLRARQMDLPVTRRILELNSAHPLLRALGELMHHGCDDQQIDDWIEVVYAQAQLAEGSPVDDPARLAQQLTQLLTSAASAASQRQPTE